MKKKNLFNDIYSTIFFKGHKECVEAILRPLLKNQNLVIDTMEVQDPVKDQENRSIIVDVVAYDNEGKRYNIEIQKAKQGASLQRARYIHAKTDIENLKKGQDFKQITQYYVIFISEEDPFGFDMPLYHCITVLEENYFVVDNGIHTLYLNCSYQKECEVEDLIHDFKCTDAKKLRIKEFNERASAFTQEELMKFKTTVSSEIRDKAYAEGIEKGIEKGKINSLVNNLQLLMKKSKLTAEEVMDFLEVDSDIKPTLLGMLNHSSDD